MTGFILRVIGYWCCLCLVVQLGKGQVPSIEEAWSLAAKGEQQQAMSILKSLIQRSPSNGEAHLFLGSLQSESGLRDERVLSEG